MDDKANKANMAFKPDPKPPSNWFDKKLAEARDESPLGNVRGTQVDQMGYSFVDGEWRPTLEDSAGSVYLNVGSKNDPKRGDRLAQDEASGVMKRLEREVAEKLPPGKVTTTTVDGNPVHKVEGKDKTTYHGNDGKEVDPKTGKPPEQPPKQGEGGTPPPQPPPAGGQ
jgi:hypothetical protein